MLRFKKTALLSALAIAGAMFVGTSCNSNSQTADDSQLAGQVDTIQQMAANDVDAAKASLQTKMDSLDARMAELNQNIKDYTGEKKAQAQEELDQLKVKKDELKQKMSDLADKAADKGEELKDKASDTYDSAKANVKDALN